jgi:hypothetical protein
MPCGGDRSSVIVFDHRTTHLRLRAGRFKAAALAA